MAKRTTFPKTTSFRIVRDGIDSYRIVTIDSKPVEHKITREQYFDLVKTYPNVS